MTTDTIKQLLAAKDTDFDAITKWITSERKFWVFLSKTLMSPGDLYNTGPIIAYMSLLDKQYEDRKNLPLVFDLLAVNKICEFAIDNYIPNHDHPIAADLKRASGNSQILDQALFHYKVAQGTADSFFRQEYLTRYKNLINEHREEFQIQTDKYLAENERFVRAITEGKNDLETHLSSLKISVAEELSELGKEKGQEISEISSKINKAITSSEPVIFWKGKEEFHREQAIKCKRTAVALGTIASLILLFLVLAAFKDQDTTEWLGFKLPNHFYIAVCLLIGSAFVWALRIAVQLMMTHVSLESEAIEKSTAINTYVALSKQGIDEEIEKDFHRALLTFNKIKISDDSSHPEILKLLEQILNKKNPS